METGPVPSASAAAPRPEAPIGPQIVVERPPPGLARGKYGWPAWGIGALGTLVVLLGVAFLIWRARRRGPAAASRDSDRRASR